MAKLTVFMLPSLLFFNNGVSNPEDRLMGFDGLEGGDEFSTRTVGGVVATGGGPGRGTQHHTTWRPYAKTHPSPRPSYPLAPTIHTLHRIPRPTVCVLPLGRYPL